MMATIVSILLPLGIFWLALTALVIRDRVLDRGSALPRPRHPDPVREVLPTHEGLSWRRTPLTMLALCPIAIVFLPIAVAGWLSRPRRGRA